MTQFSIAGVSFTKVALIQPLGRVQSLGQVIYGTQALAFNWRQIRAFTLATSDEITNTMHRNEINLVKPITDKVRVKAGPSLIYSNVKDWPIDRTGYGYQVSGEIDLTDKLYISPVYNNYQFKGSVDQIDVKTEVNSFQLRIGYSF